MGPVRADKVLGAICASRWIISSPASVAVQQGEPRATAPQVHRTGCWLSTVWVQVGLSLGLSAHDRDGGAAVSLVVSA